MNAIYVLGDEKFSNVCKIGFDSNWPSRFEQSQSHNPRRVVVYGLWKFSSRDELRDIEARIGVALASCKRTQTHGREWYDISPENAVGRLVEGGVLKGCMTSDPIPQLEKRELPYDDWRKQSDEYKRQVYKRILWVFREESPEARLKVIHSPLYDTCYQYAFTYNPFPVHLVAAYHHPMMTEGPSYSLRSGNEAVRSAWEHMVGDLDHGPGLSSVSVGWLRESATQSWIESIANRFELVPFDLAMPKPSCVRPTDGYGAKAIPCGSQPPMRRVCIDK